MPLVLEYVYVGTFTGNAAEFKVLYVMESCKLVLAIKKKYNINHKVFLFCI